jgi:hypothetical protein
MNVTNMNYQILQTLLVLIFLLQTAGSDPELSGGEGGHQVSEVAFKTLHDLLR